MESLPPPPFISRAVVSPSILAVVIVSSLEVPFATVDFFKKSDVEPSLGLITVAQLSFWIIL